MHPVSDAPRYSAPVKIGLPDGLRYGRYGVFWEKFLPLVGGEVLRPQAAFADAYRAGALLLPDAPPSAQGFVGQVLELVGDPWNSDLALVLRHRLTLPPLWAVPLAYDERALGAATRWGQVCATNPQLLRRALERAQGVVKAAAYPEPRWSLGSHHTVAVIGEPNLLETPALWQHLRDALAANQLHAILGQEFSPEALATRGQTVLPNLGLETEQEIAGAYGLFASKAAIQGMIFLEQPRSAINKIIKKLHRQHNGPKLYINIEDVELENKIEEFSKKIRE
jgi:hypothetical protein